MAPRRCAAVAILALVAGCASAPPDRQGDVCAVLDQNPEWYDYARASERAWGTPAHVQLAFVRHESSYRGNARPARRWLLGFIPLGRPSSAKGYAQIQDPVWEEYESVRGSLFRSRGDMEDALDFIGWYNDRSHRRLGIAKSDAKRLYLAYHEGHGGYARRTFAAKPDVVRYADRVARTARTYESQLARCDERFRCRKWYQVGPFCD